MMLNYECIDFKSILDDKLYDDVYLFSKNRKREVNSNAIICLDIETTQMYLVDGHWICYDFDLDESKYEGCDKCSFPYIWMLGIEDLVIYGRCFDDLVEVFDEINSREMYVRCFVHNLNFEFSFLRNLFHVERVFAKKAHDLMYCIFEEIPFIEFRCSYQLTRLSCADWGLQISKETGRKVNKLVGELDYNLYRYGLKGINTTDAIIYTPMFDYELDYCEYDIRVMYEGLCLYRNKYVRIKDIPLTQTGEIRQELKKISKDCGFNVTASKLQPKEFELYQRFLQVTRGGDSHAHYLFADEILTNLDCLDYTSSYPFQMCTKRVPMSYFKPMLYDESDVDIGYILYIHLRNVKSKTTLHYIPFSKCQINGYYSLDNGRIIKANELYMWVTDMDLDIIRRTYEFDMDIIECYGSMLGYVAKPIIEFILTQFANKTKYKGVQGFESIYLASKQKVNGIYGLTITKLIQNSILFDDECGKYSIEEMTKERMFDELMKKVNYPSKNPLHYAFGLWTVTSARKMLWDGFDILGHTNVAYYDTDSYKGWFKQADVDKINAINLGYIEDMKKRYGFDDDLVYPKTPEGKVEVLGRLDREKGYDEFKTLGAKKYAYTQTNKRGEKEIHITVAGLPKKCAESLNSIDEFTNGWTLTPKQSHKLSIEYAEEQPQPTIYGYKVPYKKAAILTPIGFTNNITSEYSDLIYGV